MADGSLVFDTKIDTDGFENGTKSLKTSLERFNTVLHNTGTEISKTFGRSSKVTDLNIKIQQTEDDIRSLRLEMEQIANAKFVSNMFSDMQQQAEKTENKLRELLDQRERLEDGIRANVISLGLPESSAQSMFGADDEWKKLTAQIDLTEQSLSRYERELEKIRQRDASIDTTQTAEYRKRQQEVDKLTDKLTLYKSKLEETRQAEKKGTESNKKLGKSMDKTKRSASGLSKTMRMIGMSVTLAFAFRAISGAMNGAKEGMQNLAQYSSSTNKHMSALMSSMLQLKNAFATAFAPLLSVVVPALQNFINVLVAACNIVGQFFSVLISGSATFTQSKKVWTDYAQSIKKAGKEAAKAVAPFDELNQVAGDAGGGADISGPVVGDMFEDVKVDPRITAAVDKFRGALDKLKKALGPTNKSLQRLNKALKPLKKFTANALIDFYNNFLKPLGKWVLGEKGLPRFIDATADLAGNTKWSNLNKSLKEFWKQLEKICEFTFDTLVDFYQHFLVPLGKWALGEGLPDLLDVGSKLLSKINWDKLNKAFEDLCKALAPFAISIGTGLISFIGTMVDLLTPVVTGAVDLLAAGLEALGKAIDHIPAPVAEAVGGAIGGIATSVLLFRGVKTISSTIDGIRLAIKGLLESISAYPYVAIAAGIAALAGAIISFAKYQYKNSEMGKYAEYIDDVCSKAEELTTRINDNIAARNQQVKDIESEYGAIEILADKYFKLADKQHLSGQEKALLISYAEQLIKKIPDLKGLIDEETGAYKGTKEEIEGLINKTKEYYMVQAAQDHLTEIAKDYYDTQMELSEIEQTRQDILKKINDENERWEKSSKESLNAQWAHEDKVINLQKELKKVDDQIAGIETTQANLNKQWDKTTTYISDYKGELETISYAKATLDAANAIDDLHGIWKDGQQILGNDAVKIYEEIMDGLEPLENGMYRLADGSMVQFGNAIENGTPEAVSTAKSLMDDINTTLGSYGKVMEDNGRYLVRSHNGGVIKEQGETKKTIDGWMAMSTNGLKEKLYDDFQGFGGDTVSGLNSGIATNQKTTQTAIGGWASCIQRWFTNLMGIHSPSRVFKGYGKNIVDGLNDGVSDNQGKSGTVIGNWVKSIKGWFADKLDIHSPSRVFRSFGENVVAGFNDGIKDNLKSTGVVFKAWADNMTLNPPMPTMPTLPYSSYPVPALATGAVIPPNAPFLAMLGDQRHGTNIEAPLDTIVKAFQSVAPAGGDIHLTVELDGNVVYKTVVDKDKQRVGRTGRSAFAY